MGEWHDRLALLSRVDPASHEAVFVVEGLCHCCQTAATELLAREATSKIPRGSMVSLDILKAQARLIAANSCMYVHKVETGVLKAQAPSTRSMLYFGGTAEKSTAASQTTESTRQAAAMPATNGAAPKKNAADSQAAVSRRTKSDTTKRSNTSNASTKPSSPRKERTTTTGTTRTNATSTTRAKARKVRHTATNACGGPQPIQQHHPYATKAFGFQP